MEQNKIVVFGSKKIRRIWHNEAWKKGGRHSKEGNRKGVGQQYCKQTELFTKKK